MKRIEIERLLPEVFRATLTPPGPLAALLDVMSALHAPSEHILDHIDGFFDASRTQDRFVPLLARWVDLDRLFVQSATGPAANAFGGSGLEPISTGTGRLRELIARAAYLSHWRGTRTGLIAFLETATGVQGFDVDEQILDDQGLSRPFHIRVHVPQGVEQAHWPLIERIIEFEKPAYVTYDLTSKPGLNHGTPV